MRIFLFSFFFPFIIAMIVSWAGTRYVWGPVYRRRARAMLDYLAEHPEEPVQLHLIRFHREFAEGSWFTRRDRR